MQPMNQSPRGGDFGLLQKLRLEYSYEGCDETDSSYNVSEIIRNTTSCLIAEI